MTREKQLSRMISKHKELIRQTQNEVEEAELYGAWVGMLFGLWVTGAVTSEDHRELYQDMMKFMKEEQCERTSKKPA